MFRWSSCSLLVCVAVAALACESKQNKPRAKQRTSDAGVAARKPRLVVLVVIDQLPSWSFGPQAKYMKAGIGRLLKQGVYYPRAQYPYAITYTAPGHAALATGAPPAVTGVLANGWYLRDVGRSISAIGDPRHPILLINPTGDTAKNKTKRAAGASAARLRVTGVGDWLRAQTSGKGKAVAVSLKDRAANFALGQHPNLAIWYDPGQAAMTTSSYYAKTPPSWLVTLARQKPVSAHFDYVWRPSSVELLKKVTGNLDNAPGEGALYGLDNVFPHELGKAQSAKAVRLTPIGPRITTETAIAAIHGEKLGVDDVPDVLVVSYSSHDYAGHTWGQESWERFDLLLHIDKQIGVLLAELDRVVGADRYAVVLTSDHGVTRMVEQAKQRKQSAHRIKTKALMEPVIAAAESVLGKGTWIAAGSASTIYLSKQFTALGHKQKQRAMGAMINALRRVKGIAYVVPTAGLHGNCDTKQGLDALICRSIDPKLSGEIFVAVAPGSIFSGDFTTGTTHGSPNPDDRFVPLIISVPGQQPRVVKDEVSTLRVAATLAHLLGIKPARTATSGPLD